MYQNLPIWVCGVKFSKDGHRVFCAMQKEKEKKDIMYPVSHLSPVGTKAAEVVEVCQSIRETHQATISFSSVELQTLIIWD